MGVDSRRRRGEVAAIRLGIDLGMTLIDTAEMYGDAEKVVGEAIRGRREDVQIVTKVLPQNASLDGTMAAAERSLRRLGTDRIDLYLLHWEGAHPLADTLEAFLALQEEGKIVDFGVSNFDIGDMDRCEALPGGSEVAANQVYYNLARRGIERKLLPWCAEHGVIVMAYTPLESGKLSGYAALRTVARRHGATPAQIAIAWTLRHPGVVSIPKASTPEHVRENASSLDVVLTSEDLADLDASFPPPDRDVPLETA
jgi:diketogulonate reductase-like aldo/keto reductase